MTLRSIAKRRGRRGSFMAGCLAAVLCGLPLLAPPALGAPALNRGDNFMGWSKDGTFYLKVTLVSETNFDAYICPTRPGVKVNWPKLFFNSSAGGAPCKQVNDRGSSLDDALQTVVPIRPSLTGPRGEKVSAKVTQLDEEHFETVITVVLKKRKTILADKPITDHRLRVMSAAWHPDGSEVAVVLADHDDRRLVLMGELAGLVEDSPEAAKPAEPPAKK